MKRKLKMKDALEGKTLDEQVKWFKRYLAYHVSRSRMLGKIEAYLEMGLTPLQIAERIGIPESSARRYAYDLELEKERKSK